MRGRYWVTLELGHASSLDVEIGYEASPAEPMVEYYRDGSGYPGSPPAAKVLSTHVGRWDVGDERRKRGDGWIWSELDRIAETRIEADWNTYREDCLEDAAERQEDSRY